MTDRELVGVFWGTVAAIPVILLIVWGVNRGLDQQDEVINAMFRYKGPLSRIPGHESSDSPANMAVSAPGPLDHTESSTAAETADQPSASDSPRRGGGTSFQEQEQ